MTRKDYVKIASVMKLTKPAITEDSYDTWWDINRMLQEVLKHDNPRFDYQKWKTFIGI